MQKLLIVEDDHSVRNTMVTCLELEGYAPRRSPPRARPLNGWKSEPIPS